MGTDVGKSAKYLGKLHPRDAKKLDRVPPRPTPGVPPHKIPRSYVLKVIETTQTVSKRTYRYESKQARDQARKRMEKEAAYGAKQWGNWSRPDESYKTDRSVEYIEEMLTG